MNAQLPDQQVFQFANQLDWAIALNDRAQVDAEPAVYAITSDLAFGRLTGVSSVLYVGKATRLGGQGDRTRLYGYRYQPAGSRDGRVRALAENASNLGHTLSLRWLVLQSEQEAAQTEAALLQDFLLQHLEVPPLNSQA